MISFYPLTLLLVAVGLHRAVGRCSSSSASRDSLTVLKVFAQPKPAGPPPGYPERGWPLWFVG